MIDLKFNVNWTNQKQFEQAPEIFREEKAAALTEAGMLLEREIAARTAEGATGILRKSIAAQLFGDRMEVGTPIAYAEPVEYGSKAHWAPLAPLEMWALRKFGDAEIGKKVWYSIAHKGTRAALMFTRGFAASASKIMKILEGIGDKVAMRFNK